MRGRFGLKRVWASRWHWAFTIAIVIYPLLWIWQGLDFTDTGFAITNYNLIFRDPHSIHYWGFNYWLTDVVGGVWLLAFGKLGLFGIRLASALLMLATNYLVYRLYRGWMAKGVLLLTILVGETLIERMYWLNYDNLSAFLFVVSGFFLIRGLAMRSSTRVFLAGLVLGVNMFARVTNAAGLVMILAIFISAAATHTTVRKQIAQAVFFLLGVIGASAAVILAMRGMGQWTDFVENLGTLFSIAGGHGNTHSSASLLTQLMHDQTFAWRTVLYALAVFLCLSLGNFLLKRVKPHVSQVIFNGVSLLTVIYILGDGWQDRFQMVAGLTGILYGTLIFSLMVALRRKDGVLASATSVSLLILFSVPLGSDFGIRLSVYGMYLALPLASHLLWTILPAFRNLNRIGWTSTSLRSVLIILLLGLFTVGLISGYQYTYRDVPNRLSMTEPLKNAKLQFVYTTAARANVTNQLLDVLPTFVHPNDVLMAYEETSLLYYLTDSRPYLNTSWPMLYDPNRFQSALKQAEQSHHRLPVVVRATGATADFYWPNVTHLRLDYRHNMDRALMNLFLKQHHYLLAWENSFFQILVPPNFKPGSSQPGR